MAKVALPPDARKALYDLLRRYRLSGAVRVAADGEVYVKLQSSVAMVTASAEKMDLFEEELGGCLKQINATHSEFRVEIVRALPRNDFAEMMRRRRHGTST